MLIYYTKSQAAVPQRTKELLPKHDALKMTRLQGSYHNNILIYEYIYMKCEICID